MRGQDCEAALDMPLDDFEDAILVVCGHKAKADFRTCYTIRVLEHFAEFWGLAEIEGDAGDYQREDMRRIRKMPLLNDLVRFSIP